LHQFGRFFEREPLCFPLALFAPGLELPFHLQHVDLADVEVRCAPLEVTVAAIGAFSERPALADAIKSKTKWKRPAM
jgi:hypothetical protein